MPQVSLSKQYSLYYQRANILYQRPQVKASVEIIISVFVVTALIFLAIRPTIANVFELQKKITDLEIVEKKADNKVSQLLAAQSQIQDNAPAIALYNSAVPDGMNYWQIAKRIELTAKNNLVKINQLTFQGGPLGDSSVASVDKEKVKTFISRSVSGVNEVQIKFSISGDQKGVLGFVDALEKMDRLALVKELSLNKQPPSKDTTNYKLKAEGIVSFYFYSIPK